MHNRWRTFNISTANWALADDTALTSGMSLTELLYIIEAIVFLEDVKMRFENENEPTPIIVRDLILSLGNLSSNCVEAEKWTINVDFDTKI